MTFFDTCREINQYLGVVVFAFLCYWTVRSWPAEWAKPDHVWHYRILLLINSGLTLATSLAAWHYEHVTPQVPADPVSSFYTAMSVLVLILCWRWPRPRPFREEQ